MNIIEQGLRDLKPLVERQNILSEHTLEIERNMAGLGWDGFCSCSDYDYEDGWSGGVFFHGTKDDVMAQHFDHVLEVAA